MGMASAVPSMSRSGIGVFRAALFAISKSFGDGSTPMISVAALASSGEMLREFRGHGGAVFSAAFSPDGARIVTASQDGTARVWDVSWMTWRGEELVRR